jgi:hypothetical protein
VRGFGAACLLQRDGRAAKADATSASVVTTGGCIKWLTQTYKFVFCELKVALYLSISWIAVLGIAMEHTGPALGDSSCASAQGPQMQGAQSSRPDLFR